MLRALEAAGAKERCKHAPSSCTTPEKASLQRNKLGVSVKVSKHFVAPAYDYLNLKMGIPVNDQFTTVINHAFEKFADALKSS